MRSNREPCVIWTATKSNKITQNALRITLLTSLLFCHLKVPHEIFGLLLWYHIRHSCLHQWHGQQTDLMVTLYFYTMEEFQSWQKFQMSVGSLARIANFDNEWQAIDTEGTHCDAKLWAWSYSWFQITRQFQTVRLACYQLHKTPTQHNNEHFIPIKKHWVYFVYIWLCETHNLKVHHFQSQWDQSPDTIKFPDISLTVCSTHTQVVFPTLCTYQCYTYARHVSMHILQKCQNNNFVSNYWILKTGDMMRPEQSAKQWCRPKVK